VLPESDVSNFKLLENWCLKEEAIKTMATFKQHFIKENSECERKLTPKTGARGDRDSPPSLGTRRPRSIGTQDISSSSWLQTRIPMHATTNPRRDEQSLSFLVCILRSLEKRLSCLAFCKLSFCLAVG
jgi:hypothetical protein